jgi:hypothetical protein
MVSMHQRQKVPPARWTVAIALALAVIVSSVAIFYGSVFGSGCGHDLYSTSLLPSDFLAASTSLSAKESYGFFDDLPDAGWRLQQQRARTHVNYMYPFKPQTGYDDPIMWYLNNLQVGSYLMSHER